MRLRIAAGFAGRRRQHDGERGVLFHGGGNYGSTVFDPDCGGGNLVVAVCDACLLARKDAVVLEEYGTVSNEFGTYDAVIARGPWEPSR